MKNKIFFNNVIRFDYSIFPILKRHKLADIHSFNLFSNVQISWLNYNLIIFEAQIAKKYQ